MKLFEILAESLTTPYKVNFHNSVEWGGSKSGRSKLGVDGEFTTDAGINYTVIGFKVGPTKDEREQKAAAKIHIQKRIDAGERVLRIPGNQRMGGIWEIHFAQQDKDRDYKKDKSKLTGTGNEFRIFSTVFEVIERITKEYKPKIISIKVEDEANRIRLYKRMAKKFAPKLGYTYTKTVAQSGFARIHIHRDDEKGK